METTGVIDVLSFERRNETVFLKGVGETHVSVERLRFEDRGGGNSKVEVTISSPN